jgi:caffeoyl-CoA O-methyltransferase
MTLTTFMLSEELQAYVRAHSEPPDDIERDLIAETARMPNAQMQVAPEQARFLGMLVRLCRAAVLLEVGTFTGYSALAMARALPDGGRMICCDISAEWTAIARRYWERAGVADRIELRLGPALETLRAMAAGEQFDLAFVDADKAGYPSYFDEVVPRLRTGGLLLADNVLSRGRVIDATINDDGLHGIREFNRKVVDDPRLEALLLPAFDGLTLALKR